MKTQSTQRWITAVLSLAAAPALAHEGHGMSSGGHWHATDAWGLVGLAIALAVAVWLARGGKR